MAAIGFLIVPVLILLGVSVVSDGQWGRGVRGAVRQGVSGVRGQGVRGGLAGVRSGWLSGVKDTSPSTRRTVGKTPPKDTVLSGVLGKLSGLSSRGVRAVRDRVSGRSKDTDRPLLLMRPDGTSEYVNIGDNFGEVNLKPGERIVNLDRFGATGETAWDYEDQQEVADFSPSRFEPSHACGYCKDTKRWPSQEEGDTCPWCTGALSLLYSRREPNGEVYAHQIAWTPGDRIPESEDGFRVMDPATGDSTGRVTAAELAQMADIWPTEPIPAVPAAVPTHEGVTPMTAPTQQAGAIETLPDYRRYLAAALDRALGELEDAQAGAKRHRDQAVSIAEGVSRLIALKADPATVGEGNRVAEGAQLAAEASTKLAGQLADLVSAIQAAIAGARRHDQVQESHDSGVHLDREAYQGA